METANFIYSASFNDVCTKAKTRFAEYVLCLLGKSPPVERVYSQSFVVSRLTSLSRITFLFERTNEQHLRKVTAQPKNVGEVPVVQG